MIFLIAVPPDKRQKVILFADNTLQCVATKNTEVFCHSSSNENLPSVVGLQYSLLTSRISVFPYVTESRTVSAHPIIVLTRSCMTYPGSCLSNNIHALAGNASNICRFFSANSALYLLDIDTRMTTFRAPI